MNFISPQLEILILQNMDTDEPYLYFKFKGKFTRETSIAGTKSWATYMDQHPNKKFEFVWDCDQMTGFEISARKEWYDVMQGYKHRISKVYVISKSLMIRSAAKVMLQFFKIPSEIVQSGGRLPTTIQS